MTTDQTPHTPGALHLEAPARDGGPASASAPFSNRGGAPVGNTNAVVHGAFSPRLINPRANEIVAATLAAHPHLDAAKDGASLARYGLILARLARSYDWLAAQADDVFSDPDAGTVHAVLERVERWERQAADAEHRLAIDPYTRSKLGLVQAQAFDLAQMLSALPEVGRDG